MTSPQPQHKFRILQRVATGALCQDQAEEILGVSNRTLHQLQTIWQAELPKLVPLIDSLLLPKKKKREQTVIKLSIAKQLKISYRQVNRLLKSAEIVIPTPESARIRTERYVIAKKKKKDRRKSRFKWALDVIFGHCTAEHAAEQAQLSARQMYRVCGQACHLAGLDYRDFHTMDDKTRRKAAILVEKAIKKELGNV